MTADNCAKLVNNLKVLFAKYSLENNQQIHKIHFLTCNWTDATKTKKREII